MKSKEYEVTMIFDVEAENEDEARDQVASCMNIGWHTSSVVEITPQYLIEQMDLELCNEE